MKSSYPSRPQRIALNDPYPVGTRVLIAGTIIERLEGDDWLVQVDGGEIIVSGDVLAAAKTRSRRNGKASELDALAASGVMPEKPQITSPTNKHMQGRLDKLAELAAAGDWDGIRGYECNGVNSYAEMVRKYRDRLIAAHNATA